MADAAEKKAEQQAEAARSVGLDDHRPLTTGDLPALAGYIKEVNKTSSSGSSPKSKSSSSRSRSAKSGGGSK